MDRSRAGAWIAWALALAGTTNAQQASREATLVADAEVRDGLAPVQGQVVALVRAGTAVWVPAPATGSSPDRVVVVVPGPRGQLAGIVDTRLLRFEDTPLADLATQSARAWAVPRPAWWRGRRRRRPAGGPAARAN